MRMAVGITNSFEMSETTVRGSNAPILGVLKEEVLANGAIHENLWMSENQGNNIYTV